MGFEVRRLRFGAWILGLGSGVWVLGCGMWGSEFGTWGLEDGFPLEALDWSGKGLSTDRFQVKRGQLKRFQGLLA